MPRPTDDPQLNGAEQMMESTGLDDPLLALIVGFRYELPDGELPPDDVTAPIVRESAYLRSQVTLSEWVGDGKDVTGTDVLRPVDAHAAYDELRRSYEHYPPPVAVDMGLDAWVEARAADPWRNAADCEALDRLWRGGVASGMITIDGRTARSTFDESADDEGWLSYGVLALLQVLDDLRDGEYTMSGFAYAMLRSYTRQRALVPWEEIFDFVDYWNHSDEERGWDAEDDFDPTPLRRSIADHGIAAIADTGIFDESDAGLRLTPFGDVVVSAWLGTSWGRRAVIAEQRARP